MNVPREVGQVGMAGQGQWIAGLLSVVLASVLADSWTTYQEQPCCRPVTHHRIRHHRGKPTLHFNLNVFLWYFKVIDISKIITVDWRNLRTLVVNNTSSRYLLSTYLIVDKSQQRCIVRYHIHKATRGKCSFIICQTLVIVKYSNYFN